VISGNLIVLREYNKKKPTPVISNQTVTITVPGSAADWRVDFYDPNTGKELGESLAATRKGTTVTIALPDFTDSIAFKMAFKK
jgi:hypothetical protein